MYPETNIIPMSILSEISSAISAYGYCLSIREKYTFYFHRTHSIITNTSMYLKTTSNHVLGEIILSEAVPFLSIIMDNTIWSSLIVIGVT